MKFLFSSNCTEIFFWGGGGKARGRSGGGWFEWVGGASVNRLFYNLKQRLKYLTLTWGDPLAIFAISVIKQCPTLKLVTGRPNKVTRVVLYN